MRVDVRLIIYLIKTEDFLRNVKFGKSDFDDSRLQRTRLRNQSSQIVD